jgi:hypothetical protein
MSGRMSQFSRRSVELVEHCTVRRQKNILLTLLMFSWNKSSLV